MPFPAAKTTATGVCTARTLPAIPQDRDKRTWSPFPRALQPDEAAERAPPQTCGDRDILLALARRLCQPARSASARQRDTVE